MNATIRHTLRAFRSPNYRTFFLGQGAAVTGTWMTLAALGWLLFRLTRDPFQLGLMGFFMHAPTFFLAPLGGLAVDILSRRGVIVATQVANTALVAVLAVLTLWDVVQVWHVMAICAGLGVVKAFEMPARQALVVDIVEDRLHLSNAIALNSSLFHAGRLVGPMLAGALIIPWAGEGACFLAHAALNLFAIVCFLALRPRSVPPLDRSAGVLHHLREGFAYAFGYPPVRALLIHLTVFSLLGQAYGTLLPVFAETILDGGARMYGGLLAASGVGALIAAVQLAARASVLGLGGVIFRQTLLFSTALALFAISRHAVLSFVLLALVGMASISVMVSANTIIQTLVEDRLRGRVMSLMGMVFLGAMPVGALAYGKLAQVLGAPAAVAMSGMGCMIAGLAFGRRLPGLRRLARPVYAQRGILPPETA